MNYIQRMRKAVGKEPMILAGAFVLVCNEREEILLQLRSDTNNWGGHWGHYGIRGEF